MTAADGPPSVLRPARATDVVGGQPARYVAAPRSVDELASTLARCARDGLAATPRGAGTKIDWGRPPLAVDVIVDVTHLPARPELAAGDLVATFPAGTKVRAAQASLSEAGLRLALDPGSIEATIGGVLATGECGPLRHRYGTPGDQLLGADVVLADGSAARLGGVTGGAPGYDLARLVCGSFGTLAVVVSATLQLHRRPARRAWTPAPRTPRWRFVTWSATWPRSAHRCPRSRSTCRPAAPPASWPS